MVIDAAEAEKKGQKDEAKEEAEHGDPLKLGHFVCREHLAFILQARLWQTLSWVVTIVTDYFVARTDDRSCAEVIRAAAFLVMQRVTLNIVPALLIAAHEVGADPLPATPW